MAILVSEKCFRGWAEMFFEHFQEHFIELPFSGTRCNLMIDRVVKLKTERQNAARGEG